MTGAIALGPSRGKGFVGALLITVGLIGVLATLGVWQLHRLAWKRELLAEIARAETLPPVVLMDQPPSFRKVFVSGRLRFDLAALYGADVRDTPRGPVLGGQLLVPLARAPAPVLMVDLGWVPDAMAHPQEAPSNATVFGYIRAADRPGWFSASDDRTGRRFYTLDPQAIGNALGLTNVAPFTLIALGGPPIAGAAAAEHLPQPPNDHLSYAITWFGLAGVLLVIFLTWSWKNLRS